MSDEKPKSTLLRLLESGPTDPLLIEKLHLLEELRAAHRQNDHKTMLDIGQKLAANDKAIQQAQRRRRATMKKTVAQASAVADPEERAMRLLAAFEFCVVETCAADDEGKDLKTYNFGVRQLSAIGDELRAAPSDRFAELARFLDHPDIRVRGFAAVWLKDVLPDRVLPVLIEVRKVEPFGTGVGTQVFVALSEFEKKNGESYR